MFQMIVKILSRGEWTWLVLQDSFLVVFFRCIVSDAEGKDWWKMYFINEKNWILKLYFNDLTNVKLGMRW